MPAEAVIRQPMAMQITNEPAKPSVHLHPADELNDLVIGEMMGELRTDNEIELFRYIDGEYIPGAIGGLRLPAERTPNLPNQCFPPSMKRSAVLPRRPARCQAPTAPGRPAPSPPRRSATPTPRPRAWCRRSTSPPPSCATPTTSTAPATSTAAPTTPPSARPRPSSPRWSRLRPRCCWAPACRPRPPSSSRCNRAITSSRPPSCTGHCATGCCTDAAEWGLRVDLVDTSDLDALRAALRPGATKLVWLETPANPLWTITDIRAAAELAHAAGARLAVDSTVRHAAADAPPGPRRRSSSCTAQRNT